jgi:hypothetical protein
MQEKTDKKTPKPNSKWQQKLTCSPHLRTQGDLSQEGNFGQSCVLHRHDKLYSLHISK